jgi:CelD/BcsL family acetyltransferase involved in cellulose biosynthesis
MPAFDPEWASYSPGKVLLAQLIEDAKAKGCARFDLLSGREPYKLLWQTGEVALSSLEDRQASLGTRIRTTANQTVRCLAYVRRRVTLNDARTGQPRAT